MQNTKDDYDIDKKINSIDFGGINNVGRASVAVGRSNNRLSGPMSFGS